MIRKPESIARESLRELARLLAQNRIATVEMVVSPRIAGELLSHRRQALGRLEARSGKHVDVRVSESIPVDRIVFYAYDERGADVAIDRLPKSKPPTNLIEWAVGTPGKDIDEDPQAEIREAREAERAALLAEAEEFEDENDELLANLEVDDDEDESEEVSRKSRRRRGGRGRKRRGNGENRTDDNEHNARRSDSQDGEQDGEEDGSGRRRRKRRGGRDREGRNESAEVANARAQLALLEGKLDSPPPKDMINRPLLFRGDSWDLTPNELDGLAKRPDPDKLRAIIAGAETNEESADPKSNGRVNGQARDDQKDDSRPSRRSRSRRGGRSGERKGQGPAKRRAGMDRATGGPETLSDRGLPAAARLGPAGTSRTGKRTPKVRGLIVAKPERLPKLKTDSSDAVTQIEAAAGIASREPRRVVPNAVLTVAIRLRQIAEKRRRNRRRQGGRNRK